MVVVYHATKEQKDRIKLKQKLTLMEQYHVSENAAAILQYLQEQHDIYYSNSELAEQLNIPAKSVAGVVNSLVKKGLVVRREYDKKVRSGV